MIDQFYSYGGESPAQREGLQACSRRAPAAGAGVDADLHALGAGPGGWRRRAQPGPDSVWRDLLTHAGFTRFRRAAETPFHRVFEVRP